ncbi:MAG: hypothetical protein ABI606_02570 [Rhodoferax sp.]
MTFVSLFVCFTAISEALNYIPLLKHLSNFDFFNFKHLAEIKSKPTLHFNRICIAAYPVNLPALHQCSLELWHGLSGFCDLFSHALTEPALSQAKGSPPTKFPSIHTAPANSCVMRHNTERSHALLGIPHASTAGAAALLYENISVCLEKSSRFGVNGDVTAMVERIVYCSER